MAEMVEITNHSIQILCFVHTSISAIQMKKRVDSLTKLIETQTIYFSAALKCVQCQILIGTPQELSKIVLNDQIPLNTVRFVFIDDADVTIQFDSTKSAFQKLSGFSKFIAYSSSVVHNVKCIIPDVEIFVSCTRYDVISNKITHFVANTPTFDAKISLLLDVIERIDENVIIFASARILF